MKKELKFEFNCKNCNEVINFSEDVEEILNNDSQDEYRVDKDSISLECDCCGVQNEVELVYDKDEIIVDFYIY